jgi:hypothetical protein
MNSEQRSFVLHGVICAFSTLVLAGMITPVRALAVSEATPCQPEPVTRTLNYGDVLDGCTIAPIADSDVLNISMNTGDVFRLISTLTAGPYASTVCVEALDPNAGVFYPKTCGGTVQANKTVVIPGTYVIVVSEGGDDQSITYNLSIERLFPLRSPTALEGGQVISEEINPITDLDTYKFNATANDFVRIVATLTAGPYASAVCAELFDPDHQGVGSIACGGTVPIEQTLQKTGVYSLVITESNNDQAISYNLSLNCLVGSGCPAFPCTLFLNTSKTDTTLTLNFALGTKQPATWNLWVSYMQSMIPLWSLSAPVVDPVRNFPVNISNYPHLGSIGFYTTLTSPPTGLLCSDSSSIDTGQPAGGTRVPSIQEIQQLFQSAISKAKP